MTSDVAALADVCHERGVPLIVDAAWGGASAFCEQLPDSPFTKGADVAVYSAHKTMGALAQGSVIVAKGDFIDRQRLWMAYELFETTSPSVPILATLDATRRDHALHGERLWGDVLDMAERLRSKLSAMTPLRVFERDHLPADSVFGPSKVLIDVSALNVSGYAVDDWLYKQHRISVGLSDARHLLLLLSLGTTRSDVRKFVRAIRDLLKQLASNPGILPACAGTPSISILSVEMAAEGPATFNGPAETITYEYAAG